MDMYVYFESEGGAKMTLSGKLATHTLLCSRPAGSAIFFCLNSIVCYLRSFYLTDFVMKFN